MGYCRKRSIKLEKHPFLFLFSIVDTIEPLKTLKHASNLSKVKIIFNADSIEFDCNRLYVPFKTEYVNQIISLHSWLTNTKERKSIVTIHLNK
jgi:hypothetical protein